MLSLKTKTGGDRAYYDNVCICIALINSKDSTCAFAYVVRFLASSYW
jgi:hypothetical protein